MLQRLSVEFKIFCYFQRYTEVFISRLNIIFKKITFPPFFRQNLTLNHHFLVFLTQFFLPSFEVLVNFAPMGISVQQKVLEEAEITEISCVSSKLQ